MRGRVARTIASASSSDTSPVRRHGSIWASKQPSAFHRFPIPAMIRWSSSASPIGRVGSSSRSRRRKPRLVELRGEDVRAEHRQAAVEAGAAVGHQLQHRAVDLRDEHVLVAQDQPRVARRAASRRRGRATCRSSAGGCGSSARPRSAGTGACRARRRERTARPASRSGQRSRPKRGCGVSIASGTCPSQHRAGSCSPRSGSCRPRARRPLRPVEQLGAGPHVVAEVVRLAGEAPVVGDEQVRRAAARRDPAISESWTCERRVRWRTSRIRA